jgi:hypothetical protein
VDVLGDVHIVWEDHRVLPNTAKIFYKRRTAGTWQDDQQLTFEEYTDAREPAVAVDPSGTAHVIWTDERSSFGDIYYRQCPAGSWLAEEMASSGESTSRTPAIQCDAVGNVHAVWSDKASGVYAIHYSFRNRLGWSTPLRISEGADPARAPAIAVDTGGQVHVVWEDNRPGIYTIYYKQRVPLAGDVPESESGFLAGLSCAPNPFAGKTVFRWETALSTEAISRGGPLAQDRAIADRLVLEILTPDGRCVRALSGARQGATVEFTWDGRDESGRLLSPGAYFYAARGGCLMPRGKVILAR